MKRRYGAEMKPARLVLLGLAIGAAVLWPLALLAQNTQNRMGSVKVVNHGAASYLYDSAGAASHGGATSREIVFYVEGTISATSVTVQGCMRSATNTIPGTCDTANELTFTGTATAIQQMNGGYDYYAVSGSWTGAGTVTVLGSDTVASFSSGGGGSGFPTGTATGVAYSSDGTTGAISSSILLPGVAASGTPPSASAIQSQDGSILYDTTDGGNGQNVTVQMAYEPNDTVSCTAGTGVTSCASYGSYDFAVNGVPAFAGGINYGTLKIVGGTATTGTIATLTFNLSSTNVSGELKPTQCDIIEQGSTTNHGLAIPISASTATVTAAVSVVGATIYANYVCHP